MLDFDYLGQVNNPDGLPGLYDQVPRINLRVTQCYTSDKLVCQSSPGVWYLDARASSGERGRELQNTAVSSQFAT
eukprot:4898735-Pleurochrysis_carterae.AAC.1